MMHTVLLVCTANICRSPMAMGLLRARVADEAGEWRIESAGTWTVDGQPAAANTLYVLAERGIHIEEHRSQVITRQRLEPFRLILTMERGHKEALCAEFPDLAGRIYLLTEMVGQKRDIRDPIGGPLLDFEYTALEFDMIFNQGFEQIARLSLDEDQPE